MTMCHDDAGDSPESCCSSAACSRRSRYASISFLLPCAFNLDHCRRLLLATVLRTGPCTWQRHHAVSAAGQTPDKRDYWQLHANEATDAGSAISVRSDTEVLNKWKRLLRL